MCDAIVLKSKREKKRKRCQALSDGVKIIGDSALIISGAMWPIESN